MTHKTLPAEWQIESLIKASYNRLTSRFLSYFLSYILGIGLHFAVTIVSLLVIGVLVAGALALHANFVVPVLLILGFTAFIGALFYVGSWVSLSTLTVLIHKEKPSAIDAYKSMQPLVLGYLWVTALSSLFFGGLVIWGFLSFFILFIVWGLFNTFTALVYLEYRYDGLKNLWVSMEIVTSHFWDVALRLGLLALIMFVLTSTVTYLKDASLLRFSYMIFSFLFTPFALSYHYEMFRTIKTDEFEGKTPAFWVGFSVFGWVLTIVITITLVLLFGGLVGNMFQHMSPPSLENQNMGRDNYNYKTSF